MNSQTRGHTSMSFEKSDRNVWRGEVRGGVNRAGRRKGGKVTEVKGELK